MVESLNLSHITGMVESLNLSPITGMVESWNILNNWDRINSIFCFGLIKSNTPPTQIPHPPHPKGWGGGVGPLGWGGGVFEWVGYVISLIRSKILN